MTHNWMELLKLYNVLDSYTIKYNVPVRCYISFPNITDRVETTELRCPDWRSVGCHGSEFPACVAKAQLSSGPLIIHMH